MYLLTNISTKCFGSQFFEIKITIVYEFLACDDLCDDLRAAHEMVPHVDVYPSVTRYPFLSPITYAFTTSAPLDSTLTADFRSVDDNEQISTIIITL